MFTDIVGSTNLVEALGDEAWETMLRWHNAALREVFTAQGGEEISTTGDGFFVSFDSPDLAVAAAIARLSGRTNHVIDEPGLVLVSRWGATNSIGRRNVI